MVLHLWFQVRGIFLALGFFFNTKSFPESLRSFFAFSRDVMTARLYLLLQCDHVVGGLDTPCDLIFSRYLRFFLFFSIRDGETINTPTLHRTKWFSKTRTSEIEKTSVSACAFITLLKYSK